MAVSITSGKTWTTGESCTASKLNTMFTGASISGIDQTHMAANSGLVEKGSANPSDNDALWLDTNTSNRPFYYNGSAWVPAGFTTDFISGCNVSTASGGATIEVGAGSIYINGELRTNAAAISTNPSVDPTTADYLDVWALADVAASEAFTISLVDSGVAAGGSSNPGTNGRLIGSAFHRGSGVYSLFINYRPSLIYGWGFITGDGTAAISTTITHGKTFDTEPIPFVNMIGSVLSADPTSIGGLSEGAGSSVYSARCSLSTTTAMTVSINTDTGQTLSATRRHGFGYIIPGSYT